MLRIILINKQQNNRNEISGMLLQRQLYKSSHAVSKIDLNES